MAVLENRAGIEFIQVKQVFVWDKWEFTKGAYSKEQHS